MNLVSIIVPVFEVEDYIIECLNSISGQTYDNIEILCVNGCSMDNSATLIKQLKRHDRRIHLINQNINDGLGGSRNEGLRHASGKYVQFVDSDDWIQPTMVADLVEAMETSGADYAFTGITAFDGTNSRKTWKDQPFHSQEALSLAMAGVIDLETRPDILTDIYPSAWLPLRKLDDARRREIAFPVNRIAEDHYFHYWSGFEAKRAIYIDGHHYRYRNTRPNQLSRLASPRAYQVFDAIDEARALFRTRFTEPMLTKLSCKIAVRLLWEKTHSIDPGSEFGAQYFARAAKYLSEFELTDLLLARDNLIPEEDVFFLCGRKPHRSVTNSDAAPASLGMRMPIVFSESDIADLANLDEASNLKLTGQGASAGYDFKYPQNLVRNQIRIVAKVDTSTGRSLELALLANCQGKSAAPKSISGTDHAMRSSKSLRHGFNIFTLEASDFVAIWGTPDPAVVNSIRFSLTHGDASVQIRLEIIAGGIASKPSATIVENMTGDQQGKDPTSTAVYFPATQQADDVSGQQAIREMFHQQQAISDSQHKHAMSEFLNLLQPLSEKGYNETRHNARLVIEMVEKALHSARLENLQDIKSNTQPLKDDITGLKTLLEKKWPSIGWKGSEFSIVGGRHNREFEERVLQLLTQVGSALEANATLTASGYNDAVETFHELIRKIVQNGIEDTRLDMMRIVEQVAASERQVYLREYSNIKSSIQAVEGRLAGLSDTQIDRIDQRLHRLEDAVSHNMARINTFDDASLSKLYVENWKAVSIPEYFHGNIWSWCDGFKQYYHENISTIDKKFEKLAADLDEDSIAVARWFFDACVFKIPFSVPSSKKVSLLKRDYLFSPADLAAQQKILRSYPDEIVDLRLPGGISPEIPVFHFHHGLRGLEKRLLDKIRGGDAIDGGGFIGDSALILSRYGFRKIVSVEADLNNFSRLSAFAEAQGLHQVIPVNCALDRRSGQRTFVGSDGVTTGLIAPEDQFEYMPQNVNIAETRTIDDLVGSMDLRPSFIKMDIEGMELLALQGAEETLRNFRPLLSISIYHTPEEFFDVKPYLESLNLGYKFRIEHHNPFDPVYETVLMAHAPD